MSGFSTLRISPGEQAARTSIPASPIPIRLIRVMVVKLRSEGKLARRRKVLTCGWVRKSCTPKPLKAAWPAPFTSGSTPVYPVQVARLRPPSVSDCVLGPDHPGHPIRQAVGDRYLAQLEELAVFQVALVGGAGVERGGPRPGPDPRATRRDHGCRGSCCPSRCSGRPRSGCTACTRPCSPAAPGSGPPPGRARRSGSARIPGSASGEPA